MMRYFKHHIGDYAQHTAHLSFVEDAAYHRMMRLYYQTEKPLLSDLKALARLLGARTKEERQAVETVAHEFFRLESDGWHQRRCDEEITAFQEKSQTASENGKKGGRPSKSAKPLENQETPKASDKPPETEVKADEKLPINHKPLPINHEREETESAGALADDLAPPLAIDRSLEAAAVRAWNDLAERVGLPKVQRLTSPRRRSLKARLAECGGAEGWAGALAKVEASSFLTGKTGRTGEHANWRCDLDFLLRQNKFTKLMEGGFDDAPNTSARSTDTGLSARIAALAEWSREGAG